MEENLSYQPGSHSTSALDQAYAAIKNAYRDCTRRHWQFLHASISSLQDQITHYKVHLPFHLSDIFYHQLLIERLLNETADSNIQSKHTSEIFQRFHQLRYSERETFLYYRSSISDNDCQLFVPSCHNQQLLQFDFGLQLSPLLLPIATILFARFSAFERLQGSESGGGVVNHSVSTSQSIQWTGSQAALTELIYALNEMGVLGGRQNEIRRLRLLFEKLFMFDLGNIYKTYENMRMRKKSRTPFIDGLRNALMRRMDDDDLNAL